MKKLIAIVLSVVVSISLVACGNEEFKLTGTWQAAKAEIDGATFTVSELEAMGEDEFSDFYLIIKDGGTAVAIEQGRSDVIDWEETENGYEIGYAECIVVDSLLCVDNGYGKVFFEKISDSQTVEEKYMSSEDEEKPETTQKPTPPPEATPEPTPEPIEEKNELTGIRPEFKEAMDSYEAFFDKYIDFMNRYENADTTELMNMMTDYLQYMTDFVETMEEMEEMEDEEMSTEEALYYAQVTSRISRKLMTVE